MKDRVLKIYLVLEIEYRCCKAGIGWNMEFCDRMRLFGKECGWKRFRVIVLEYLGINTVGRGRGKREWNWKRVISW